MNLPNGPVRAGVDAADTPQASGVREGLEELRRLEVNIGFLGQNRVVLQADNQMPVLLEGLPEGTASLEDTVCNVDLEGFCVWVNSFGNEVIVEACFLGIVFVNIDLPKLAASTNLGDPRAYSCWGVPRDSFALPRAIPNSSLAPS